MLAKDGHFQQYACPVVDIDPPRVFMGQSHLMKKDVPYLVYNSRQSFPRIGCVDVLMSPDGTLVAVDHGAIAIVEPI